ncbi:MAG: Crp/Fnr family transcriptional regulator [Paracoccaceae bacterium]
MTNLADLRHPPRSAAPTVEAALRKLDLFAGMMPDSLRDISRASSLRRWTDGQQLFAKGDKASAEFFVILRGRVRLSMLSAAGREMSLRHLGPGEVLGEIAALAGTPRTATAVALTDVEVLCAPADALVRAISKDPRTALAVLRLLCDRLRSTTEQLETVALYGLEARLARFLLGVAAANTGRAEVTLTLTQEQIADIICASRPKVSQAIARLERDGAILRKGARYSLDTAKLRKLANGAD